MKSDYTLPIQDPQATLENAGGKGASLARLVAAGLPVPGGFHVTTGAYRQFVNENQLQPGILSALAGIDPARPPTLEAASEVISHLFCLATIPLSVAETILKAYQDLPGADPTVAVRSSATAEDLPGASFAGQQETYLNVQGAVALLKAVRKCWASLWTARAISYRARQGIDPQSVSLAVVVQLLVDAEAAGILFTANPLSGNRDQMLVNASWGLGEAVVGGLVTPDTLTLEAASGRVLDRQTTQKRVQTVLTAGGTQEQAVPAHLQEAPVLTDAQAAELAQLGREIEALYGMPMDIEWALAGGHFAILQARPITALPEPEAPIPSEWKLPKGAYAAMRNNIVELMTDPLTPLFKTLGLAAVNASMERTLNSFMGTAGVLPSNPIIAVNEYAYYNGSVKFGPMFKLLLNIRGLLRRMFTGAVERWTEQGRPHYIQTVAHWQAQSWRDLPAEEILQTARQLAEAAIDAYMALVSGLIPAAWMSEAWFTWRYKFVRRKGDPLAPTFLMGFDNLPIRAEKRLYDLAAETRTRAALAAYLEETPTTQLATCIHNQQPPQGVEAEDWLAWQQGFQSYLRDFGHMIYNLDFGVSTPADDPAPVLETFKLFLAGGGTNPHHRQVETADRRSAAIQRIESRLKGRRLAAFRKNLARAQKYAPLREDGLAEVGLSYPLLRQMLVEIGDRLVSAGAIALPGDIFWLLEEEVAAAASQLDRGESLDDLHHLIPGRKATWRAARKASPPMALPQMKVFGVDLMALKSGGLKKTGNALKGVAASPGVVTAPACVLHGPGDFEKMNTGDVLVASLTTPAWTPLFARAAAVVTDIGGPLSHGSIVAREYGIPAVLGTGSATARIHSGRRITVDGDKGVVTWAADGKA